MSRTFKQEKGKQVTKLELGYNCHLHIHAYSNPVILGMFFDAAQRMKAEREAYENRLKEKQVEYENWKRNQSKKIEVSETLTKN